MDCGIFQTMPIRATELQPAPLSKVETIEDLDGTSKEHKISAYVHWFRPCCTRLPIPDSLIRGSSRANGMIAIV